MTRKEIDNIVKIYSSRPGAESCAAVPGRVVLTANGGEEYGQ